MHASWHQNSALSTLQGITRQKSVKTLCNKRVPLAEADGSKATCPECLAIEAKNARLYEQAVKSLEAAKKVGP